MATFRNNIHCFEELFNDNFLTHSQRPVTLVSLKRPSAVPRDQLMAGLPFAKANRNVSVESGTHLLGKEGDGGRVGVAY